MIIISTIEIDQDTVSDTVIETSNPIVIDSIEIEA